MEKTPSRLLKEFVESQKFESTGQVMEAMKEMFAEVLQQVMVCELDEQLGYEKSERKTDLTGENAERNYRNGYSKKTVKTQLGEVEINELVIENPSNPDECYKYYTYYDDGLEE